MRYTQNIRTSFHLLCLCLTKLHFVFLYVIKLNGSIVAGRARCALQGQSEVPGNTLLHMFLKTESLKKKDTLHRLVEK